MIEITIRLYWHTRFIKKFVDWCDKIDMIKVMFADDIRNLKQQKFMKVVKIRAK